MTQELVNDDPDKHTDFCEITTTKVVAKPQLIKHVCWRDVNPQIIGKEHTQYCQKIYVWGYIRRYNH